jgi:dTDP-glucose 4,6-dehydratase
MCLAIWLWTILFRGNPCYPYNVGSDEAISIRDLARNVANVFPRAPDVQVAREPAPGRPAERYVPSTKRAQLELGLRCTIGLPDAINRTVAFLNAANCLPEL